MEVMLRDSPLGRKTGFQDTYTPSLLCPLPRWDSRELLDWDEPEMPFRGVDLWNCHELTWLDGKGKPLVATVELQVPFNSKNIVESKSLKLYLASFSQSRFKSRQDVQATIENDLSACVGGPALVTLHDARGTEGKFGDLPGDLLDHLDVECDVYQPDPELLQRDPDAPDRGAVHSHLLHSLCPVTGQPDYASVMIRWTGATISQRSLLKYIVSFRRHQGFHEQVVERMFVDILRACEPKGLTVYARFTRRGGIDINPFRSNFEDPLPNIRLWRQ
ncbi:MAG: NADPH-dependent 7-cyano-7-deazaguanine reductase QueF [Pseudomonadota bacterium]